jgi:hypothetical protein
MSDEPQKAKTNICFIAAKDREHRAMSPQAPGMPGTVQWNRKGGLKLTNREFETPGLATFGRVSSRLRARSSKHELP